MPKTVLVDQLDGISKLLARVDQLREDVRSMPSPWPGMSKPRDRAVGQLKEVFDELVRYQRALLNKVGPKEVDGDAEDGE